MAEPGTRARGLPAGTGLAGRLAESAGGAGVLSLRLQSYALVRRYRLSLAHRTDSVFSSALGLVAHLRARWCVTGRRVRVTWYTVVVLQWRQCSWLAWIGPGFVHVMGGVASRRVVLSRQSSSPSGHDTGAGSFPGPRVWSGAGHFSTTQSCLMHAW